MPTRKQPGPPQLLRSQKTPVGAAKRIETKEDPEISDDESYFSSKHEPEYLTRLSLVVAKRRPARSPFRHHIRAVKHDEHIHDGPTSPAPTVSTFFLKSGETGFRYLVSEDVETERKSSLQERPPAQFTRRQRSNSEASDALPQIRPAKLSVPARQEINYDDLLDSDSDSNSDSDSLKSLEAGFVHPRLGRSAQYHSQRSFSSSQRLRGFALRPSKSTVNISSPALANRLGVPLSAELEVWA